MFFDLPFARSPQLSNRTVMGPMTRIWAMPAQIPYALMATDHGHLGTAGLIITDGASPSPKRLGHPRIPGLCDTAQTDASKATTAALHARGGEIFALLMGCGRVRHLANLPRVAEVHGPGLSVCPVAMVTDTLRMQLCSPARTMADIAHAVNERLVSAKLALDAGFDGLFILSGGFDHDSAEQGLLDSRSDLGACGRPFLANPGPVARLRKQAPPNSPDLTSFHLSGANGDTDYPSPAAWRSAAGVGFISESVGGLDLGLLNFEHSSRSHRADVVLYGVAVLVLAVSAWVTVPDRHIFAACGWALSGLAAWTLVEYLLHRFVLHRVSPFKRLHATHHQRPTALIGSPTLMTAALFGLLVFAPSLAAFGLWRACALTLGMVSGYLAYTVIHHGVHHWRGKSPWLQRRRRWHGLHHRPAVQSVCFGVTSGFWDHIFGTVYRAPPVAALR